MPLLVVQRQQYALLQSLDLIRVEHFQATKTQNLPAGHLTKKEMVLYWEKEQEYCF